jgi:hypothetical protein
LFNRCFGAASAVTSDGDQKFSELIGIVLCEARVFNSTTKQGLELGARSSKIEQTG